MEHRALYLVTWTSNKQSRKPVSLRTRHIVWRLRNFVHKTQEQLAALRNRLAAQGTILSGTTVVETARIRGEQVTAMLENRLNLLLEGFELHNVVIDDSVRDEVVEEM